MSYNGMCFMITLGQILHFVYSTSIYYKNNLQHNYTYLFKQYWPVSQRAESFLEFFVLLRTYKNELYSF